MIEICKQIFQARFISPPIEAGVFSRRKGKLADRCNYGVDLEKYIGAYPNNEKTATLIKREIREALIANPYITSVDYIEVHELKHEKLTLNVGITSIYGNLEIENITI